MVSLFQVANADCKEVEMSSIRSILEDVLEIYEGTTLASVTDEWGEIYIFEDGDYRILKFDYLYEQSKMCISAPHRPVFDYIKAMLATLIYNIPDSALLLGLGGGGLVRSLYHVFPDLPQTVVEIRPLMIELAVKHFEIPASEHIKIIQNDAKVYLQRQMDRYDIIFADLFWALKMDPMQAQEEFIRLCKSNLSDKGWLVINYDEKAHITTSLISILYHYFDDVLLCAIPDGNAVLYAGTLNLALDAAQKTMQLQEMGLKLECEIDILARAIIRLDKPLLQLNDEKDYGKENSPAYDFN